jgi:tRNA threonylcarbamoyladenosine biosynthesis protein TsaE
VAAEREIKAPSGATSGSEDETAGFGRRFARHLKRGDVVALFGELGSGKTRMVQGMCSAFNVQEPVVSPTFTIINQYSGQNGNAEPLTVYHIDCYRIASTAEIQDVGIDEFLFSDGICMIEWPDIVLPLLRDPYWIVTIEGGRTPEERIIRLNRSEAG